MATPNCIEQPPRSECPLGEKKPDRVGLGVGMWSRLGL